MTAWDELAAKILACKTDDKALEYFGTSGQNVVVFPLKVLNYVTFEVVCDHCTTNVPAPQRDTIRFQVCAPGDNKQLGGISIYTKRVTENHAVAQALRALSMAVLSLNSPANSQRAVIERDI